MRWPVEVLRIEDALACKEPATVRVFPPDIKLFVGDRWITIGHVNVTGKGFAMCYTLPPLDELASLPEAEATGVEEWMRWGARVN
jgi:hypothetical protein